MYSLEPPRRGGSYEYPQIPEFLSVKKKTFLGIEYSVYSNRFVFVMLIMAGSEIVTFDWDNHKPYSLSHNICFMSYFLYTDYHFFLSALCPIFYISIIIFISHKKSDNSGGARVVCSSCGHVAARCAVFFMFVLFVVLLFITKTRLFKYIENFTTKIGKFSNNKS